MTGTKKLVGFSRVERSEAGQFRWEQPKEEYLADQVSYIESIRFSCGHWRHQSYPSRAVPGDDRWCDQCSSTQQILWSKSEGDFWADPDTADPYFRFLKQREEENKNVRREKVDGEFAKARMYSRLTVNLSCQRCSKMFIRSARGRSVYCTSCRAARNRVSNRAQAEKPQPNLPEDVSVQFSDFNQGNNGGNAPVVTDRQPAGYKSSRGSTDGRSTYFKDLAGTIDTLCSAAANHPWWSANKQWADNLH